MNRRAKIVLGAAALTLASFATFGTITASAHGWGSGEFATSLAQKLGVSEDRVKEALTSMRAEQRAQMKANHEERLNKLVSEGKITEAQKNLILNKHDELMAKRESQAENFKDLSPQERHAKMEAERKELEKWAQDNGIEMEYLMFKMRMGPRKLR